MKIVNQLIPALLLGVAACLPLSAAPEISGEMVGNVTTTSASLCWEVSEPARSDVKVYADAAGTLDVTANFGIELQPLIANRREIRSTPEGRAMNRLLKTAMAARQVALVKVTGLTPGTSYWMRAEALDGSSVVRDTSALLPVTTASRAEFLTESRQLLVDLSSGGDLSGVIVAVANDTSPYPLFSVAGDGLTGGRAYLDLSHFLSPSGESNLVTPSGSTMDLVISLKGVENVSGNFSGNAVSFNGGPVVASASTATLGPGSFLLVATPDKPTALSGQPFFVDLRATNSLGDPLPDFNRSLTFTNAGILTGSVESTPLAGGVLDDQTLILNSLGNQVVAVSDPPSGAETSFSVNVLAYTYENYRLHYFGDLTAPEGEPAANGDGDPFDNLMEFAFGLNPGRNDGTLVLGDAFNIVKPGGPLITLRIDNDGVDFRVTFLRPKNYEALGLDYTPRFSADLQTWFGVSTEPVVLATDGEMELVSIPYPLITPNVRKARFFNIAVAIP